MVSECRCSVSMENELLGHVTQETVETSHQVKVGDGMSTMKQNIDADRSRYRLGKSVGHCLAEMGWFLGEFDLRQQWYGLAAMRANRARRGD